MSSFTLPSEAEIATGKSPDQPRVRGLVAYGLGLVAIFVVLIVALQLFMPHLIPETADSNARFVIKILTDPRNDVVLGDSYIGPKDQLGNDYAFFGRPGATTYEMRRFAETFFRNKSPDRVIIAAGAQFFADIRQQEWRSLSKESLRFQVLPFPLFVLEPDLMKSLAAGIGNWRKRALHLIDAARAEEPAANASPEATPAAEEILLRARRQIRALEKSSGGLESFYELPLESRNAILGARFQRQLPVADLAHSLAWQNFVTLLDFLEARGANVCVVRMPIVEEYLRLIAEDPEGQRFISTLEAVRQESEGRQGMRFRDFTTIAPNLPGFYFKNQDHLNDLGREVFWPALVHACFDDTAIEPPLYHTFPIANAGFEATIDGKDSCLPGWAWQGDLRPKRVKRRQKHFDASPFRSTASYGVLRPKGHDERHWWALGKSFDVDGAGPVDVRVKVFSEALMAPEGDRSDSGEFGGRYASSSEGDDAYLAVAFLDGEGKAISPGPAVRMSEPLSAQAAARGLAPAGARASWQSLDHSFEIPAGTKQLRLWIVTETGSGKMQGASGKGGRPALLLDDFELKTNAALEEIPIPKTKEITPACVTDGNI